ncbi:MAG: PqiC family protein [Luteolibacter sp.]
MKLLSCISRPLLLVSALLLSGCASGSKSYYMLTPDGPAPSGSGVGIGVGPVSLAEYIDRPNLVIQEDSNQLGVAEDHRWAGDLGDSVARVTATNLGRRLRTGNVRIYPWQTDGEVRYQITIDVRQLHSGADGYAVIEAGWRAYALPERRLIASHTFVDREPLGSSGYQPLVAAESRLLSRMADDIAKRLK